MLEGTREVLQGPSSTPKLVKNLGYVVEYLTNPNPSAQSLLS